MDGPDKPSNVVAFDSQPPPPNEVREGQAADRAVEAKDQVAPQQNQQQQEGTSDSDKSVEYNEVEEAWEQQAHATQAYIREHFENIHSTLQHLYAALWRTTEIIHQNGAEVLNVEANKVTAKEQEKERLEQSLMAYWDGIKKLMDNINSLPFSPPGQAH